VVGNARALGGSGICKVASVRQNPTARAFVVHGHGKILDTQNDNLRERDSFLVGVLKRRPFLWICIFVTSLTYPRLHLQSTWNVFDGSFTILRCFIKLKGVYLLEMGTINHLLILNYNLMATH
jgi:hypothetical protein